MARKLVALDHKIGDDSGLTLRETPEGFYRIEPQPTEAELTAFYSKEYFQGEHGTYKHAYTQPYLDMFHKKIERRIQVLKKAYISAPENMLDVACGEGWALKVFAENGWDVTGLDFTDYPCSIHNPEYTDRIVLGDVYDSLEKLRGEFYQVIQLDNILEHIPDPYRLLELCRKILDGVLIIEVPACDSSFRRYLKSNGLAENAFEVAYPDHLSYFNKGSLRNLCAKMGFKELLMPNLVDYELNYGGMTFSLNDYVNTLPKEVMLIYYGISGEMEIGNEVLGFWE